MVRMFEGDSRGTAYRKWKEEQEKKKKEQQQQKKPSNPKPKAEKQQKGTSSYTVKKDDNLWDIAEKELGNATRWPEIYKRNKSTIGKNPDLIRPGQEFSLPFSQKRHKEQMIESKLRKLYEDDTRSTKTKSSTGNLEKLKSPSSKVQKEKANKEPEKEPKKEGEDSSLEKFAKGFVRGSGTIIDTITPVTDPVKNGFIKDMNKHEWFSEDTREWINDAFKPAETKSQKVADVINQFGASTVPIGAAYKAAEKGIDAVQGVPKLFKGLEALRVKGNPDYLKEAQKGLITGTAWGAQNEANRWTTGEEDDIQDSLRNVAIEGTIGAVADPGLMKLGQLLKGVRKPTKEAVSQTSEVPLEQITPITDQGYTPQSNDLYERLAQSGLVAPKMSLSDKFKNDPFVGFAQQSSKMPKTRIQEPDIRALEDIGAPGGQRPVGYWKERYEDFTKHVNSNYDQNNLTQEALEDIWSQFARNDEDVSLEQLIDLYTKDSRRVAEDLRKDLKFGQTTTPQSRMKSLLPNLNNQQAKNIPDFSSFLPNPSADQAQKFKSTGDILRGLPTNSEGQGQTTNWSDVKKGMDDYFKQKFPNRQELNPLSGLPKALPKSNPMEILQNFNKSNQIPSGTNIRGFADTLQNSQKPTPAFRGALKLKDMTYNPISNKVTVQQANNRLNKDIEDALSFVNGANKFTAEHVTTGLRLIDELQKNGDVGRAVDVAELLAKKGTEAGQTVQAFSIYNRLSPEGILIHANRIVARTNQNLNRFSEKVKIDKTTASNLTDLATNIRSMTEQNDVANNVINLMDKAKKGTKLNDEELKSVAQFVNDAKQFIGDITPKGKPKPPKAIQNKEVRAKVVKFLDSQEAAARKRIEARRNRVNSMPVDIFYDYAVIGASKIAKGTIHLSEFAEDMVREFGDEVQPYVEQIYRKAVEMVDTQAVRTSMNRLSEIEKITNSALKTAKINEQEANSIREFAKKIGQMSGDAKDEASMELQATLQLLERPSLLQQISTAQTIAQLLNPKTMIRNSLGNELFYRVERMNKMIATPIDWTRSKITGGQRTVTFRTNNQGEYWKNWLKGAKAGWKGVSPDGLQTRYDLRPNSFRSQWNPLTYLEKTLGATLQSFDYAGYKRAVNHTLGELATLRAMNEGLSGQARKEAVERYIREADENILAIADEYGKYVTFQDNNKIAVGLQKTKRFLNADKDWGFGDLIIKYPKTPGALIARSLEYSPVGMLRSMYMVAQPLLKGDKVDVREVTEGITRAMIGSGGVTGIAWFLADRGILTGTGGTDWDIQELETMAGKSEYSLNITALQRWVMNGFDEGAAETRQGDSFVTYNWAQPIAISMSLGANAQRMDEEGETNYMRNAYNLAGGALDTMVDQSVLSGLKDAFQIYPGQSVMDKAVDIAGNIPSSFVPTAFNQTRQALDNTSRNTYDPNKTQEYMNRAINRVPGLAQSLPPGYDTLGNEKEVYQGGTNNLFNVLLNPSFVRKYNPTPEAEMVLEVLNDTGDNSVAPRRAQKYLTIDGVRYDLTPEQYSEYQQRLGEATRQGLSQLRVSGPSNSEELASEIYKMLNKVGKEVRDQMKKEVK